MVKTTKRPRKNCNIDDYLRRHASDLQYMSKASGRVQKAIIQDGKSSLVKVLVQLAGNILNGKVVLSKSQKDNLQKYADVIRRLVGGSKSVQARKDLVKKHTNQSGGFLSFLINPIAKLIGSLVNPS